MSLRDLLVQDVIEGPKNPCYHIDDVTYTYHDGAIFRINPGTKVFVPLETFEDIDLVIDAMLRQTPNGLLALKAVECGGECPYARGFFEHLAGDADPLKELPRALDHQLLEHCLAKFYAHPDTAPRLEGLGYPVVTSPHCHKQLVFGLPHPEYLGLNPRCGEREGISLRFHNVACARVR